MQITKLNRSPSFLRGWILAHCSLLTVPQIGMHLGFGALVQVSGMDGLWAGLCSALMLSPPAQFLVLKGITAGTPPVEVMLAVTLTAVRLAPMTATLMALLRRADGRVRPHFLLSHCTIIPLWIEGMRLLPKQPIDQRPAFASGMSVGFLLTGVSACLAGYWLAAALPVVLVAGLLFVTPMSFLVSLASGSRQFVEKLALALGIGFASFLYVVDAPFDVLWGGVLAGTAAVIFSRLRRTAAWLT